MRAQLFLIVCLTGCGLTLDLDEPVDASAPDVRGLDGGGIDDASMPDGNVSDGGAPDAIVVDAGGPQPDANVDRFDAGFDASMGCPPMCPPDTYCEGDRCTPFCEGDEDCDPGLVCYLESGFCGEPECTADDRCVAVEGEGCTIPSCESGRCEFTPVEFREACEYCDPLSGEILANDEDNDGFPPCVTGCTDGPNSCDCNDTNPLINPLTLAELAPGGDVAGICNGTVPLPASLLFCVTDEDEDGASVFRPMSPAVPCESDIVLELGELLEELGLSGGPDCDDRDGAGEEVFPMQDDFMDEPRDGCDSMGRCFDYNCDRREEREHPAFEHCGRALEEDGCADASGWERRAGAFVPVCGRMGALTTCRWSPEEGCITAATTEVTQRCR